MTLNFQLATRDAGNLFSPYWNLNGRKNLILKAKLEKLVFVSVFVVINPL